MVYFLPDSLIQNQVLYAYFFFKATLFIFDKREFLIKTNKKPHRVAEKHLNSYARDSHLSVFK